MVDVIDGMKDEFENEKALALKYMTILKDIAGTSTLRMVNEKAEMCAYLNSDGLFINADLVMELT